VNQTDPKIEATDLEAPPEDAFEQSLPVDDVPVEDSPVDVLPDDPEAPESDVIEQHQPAPAYGDEDWR
jgi:hypothetical protein